MCRRNRTCNHFLFGEPTLPSGSPASNVSIPRLCSSRVISGRILPLMAYLQEGYAKPHDRPSRFILPPGKRALHPPERTSPGATLFSEPAQLKLWSSLITHMSRHSRANFVTCSSISCINTPLTSTGTVGCISRNVTIHRLDWAWPNPQTRRDSMFNPGVATSASVHPVMTFCSRDLTNSPFIACKSITARVY